MTKTILCAAGILLLAACRLSPQQAGITATDNRHIDPVCGMAKGDTWTDYTLYKGDTVWFCAAAEKAAFNANPAKYENKLKKNTDHASK